MADARAIVFDLDDTLYPYRSFLRSGFDAIARKLTSSEACPPAPSRRALDRVRQLAEHLIRQGITHAL